MYSFPLRQFPLRLVIAPANAMGAVRYVHVAFRGELIEHTAQFAIFRVDEQWKGDLGTTIRFAWQEERGDCWGFWPQLLKVGNKLLVFGTRDSCGYYQTNICLPTKLLSEAKEDLKQPGPGQLPRKD